MKLIHIITHPLTLTLSFCFLLISGEAWGGFYISYILMALPHGGIHALLAVAGGVMMGAAYRLQDAGCRLQGTGYRLQDTGCRLQDTGYRLQGAGGSGQEAGERLQGTGYRVQDAGYRVQDAGERLQVAGYRVQGAGYRLQGAGYRVQVTRCRWGAILQILGLSGYVASLLIFFRGDKSNYNQATFYEAIPLLLFYLFQLLAFIFLLRQLLLLFRSKSPGPVH